MVGYNFNDFTNAAKPSDGAFQEPRLLIFYLSFMVHRRYTYKIHRIKSLQYCECSINRILNDVNQNLS